MVAGVGVDIKWSQSLAWMIGRENVGRLCLGLGLESDGEHFSAGLFRASLSNLRSGRNQDKKASLTAEAMASKVSWLAKGERLPADFVARLDPKIRDYILKGGSAQERLSRLARRVPGVFIPRHAICTIARNNDPLRRTRRDSYRESPLGDMAFLSTKYGKDDLHRMGYKDLPKDHWIAVPLADLP
ncbi:MAG: hypothetical protein IPK12_23870 [Gemmatimonadetes bacterium]|nr:hypothetical protein [Gemmatimonadota bacterium]